ncbi:MAG: rod shape-determining protein MreD [Firmicutes bacterium]|nr:rod shape-determining protein MreD [Bacillota bacterium]
MTKKKFRRWTLLGNKKSFILYLIVFFIIIIALVIQGSLLTFFILDGIIPDLLLIIVICLAFLWGEKRALVVGLMAGLLQDILFGPAIGFFCLAKMIAGLLAGLTSHEVYRDQLIGPMLTAFFVTFAHEIIVFYLTAFFWGNTVDLFVALETLFLPRAIYHFVLTMLFYPLFYRAEQKKYFYPSFK